MASVRSKVWPGFTHDVWPRGERRLAANRRPVRLRPARVRRARGGRQSRTKSGEHCHRSGPEHTRAKQPAPVTVTRSLYGRVPPAEVSGMAQEARLVTVHLGSQPRATLARGRAPLAGEPRPRSTEQPRLSIRFRTSLAKCVVASRVASIST